MLLINLSDVSSLSQQTIEIKWVKWHPYYPVAWNVFCVKSNNFIPKISLILRVDFSFLSPFTTQHPKLGFSSHNVYLCLLFYFLFRKCSFSTQKGSNLPCCVFRANYKDNGIMIFVIFLLFSGAKWIVVDVEEGALTWLSLVGRSSTGFFYWLMVLRNIK